MGGFYIFNSHYFYSRNIVESYSTQESQALQQLHNPRTYLLIPFGTSLSIILERTLYNNLYERKELMC